MTVNGWLQILVFLALILAVTKPMGVFMTRLFSREKTFLDPVLRPLERLLYRVTGVDETHEMGWTEYAVAMLLFSLVSMALLYLIQRGQGFLPFNPQKFGAVNPPALAFNTAASFTTNTNWQNYAGEATMSYLTQMAGLAYHNFISAATGIALAIAFIRGIARREKDTIGNFWVDMTRATLWVLLPWCIIGALVLVSQGVVQNLKPYDTAKLVEPMQVQKNGSNGKPMVDANGKPVSDALRFADGSFNERQKKPDGTTVEHKNWAPTKTYTYQTTDANNRVVEVIWDSQGSYARATFRYDQSGRRTQVANFDRSGNLLRKDITKYEDDGNGNWIEQRVQLGCSAGQQASEARLCESQDNYVLLSRLGRGHLDSIRL